MKRLMFLLAFVLSAAGCRPTTEDAGAAYYVQLVRGSDSDAPPPGDFKPVGPKLRKRLQCVFNWKGYWEIKRAEVFLVPGRTAREQLDAERTVELQSVDADNVALRIYSGGKLVRTRKQPAANAFCIAGACVGDHQCWFVVVRRDKPEAPTRL